MGRRLLWLGQELVHKYLGFALDPDRIVGGRPFLDLLCERLNTAAVRARIRTIATETPTAVVMLDLATEQLVENVSLPVSTVLYWKVLQLAGYSKEKKLAELEFTLDERHLMERFRQNYRGKFGAEWEEIHNSPLIGGSESRSAST